VALLAKLAAILILALQSAPPPAQPSVENKTHESVVTGRTQSYQVVLPPGYAASKKRYPVIYWFQGFEQSSAARDAEVASYVAAHDVIVVRTGPADTVGAYPLYFPELVEIVDKNLRTEANRDHRAVTGFGMGGFVALWVAGKCPDLVGSASSLMGFTEAPVGPAGFELESNLDDLFVNYAGVRTRLSLAKQDALAFYHDRLNSAWQGTRTGHQSEAFDGDPAAPGVTQTLDFHLHAFANPLPKPAVFSHSDPYPNFDVWGWEVSSDRRQPGFSVLQNVSSKGFRSSVREWVPGGATIPEVKISVVSPRIYTPASTVTVTYIRLRDGNVRRAQQKVDAQGRLSFELTGEAFEVGVSAEPVLTVTGYDIEDAAWATAGKPVKLRIRFSNKGSAKSVAGNIQWESVAADVKFESQASRLFALMPGEAAAIPVSFTAAGPHAMVRIYAVAGGVRMPIDLPIFPPAEPVTNFHIADGQAIEVFQHAVRRMEVTLGEGNEDAHAAPGESFAVLIPDGESYRAAEVFTNDACVDTSVRASDSWAEYDHAGASAKYSLPSVRAECAPGHVVHMLTRILLPNHQLKYGAIEFPVWYRKGEEPKGK